MARKPSFLQFRQVERWQLKIDKYLPLFPVLIASTLVSVLWDSDRIFFFLWTPLFVLFLL